VQNLLVIRERETPNRFGGTTYLGFEKLTYVPIQVCCYLFEHLFSNVYRVIEGMSCDIPSSSLKHACLNDLGAYELFSKHQSMHT
jgi:hypothetical protein